MILKMGVMMPDEVRLNKLEDKVDKMSESVLVFHNDLKNIGTAVQDLAASMKAMVQMQSDVRVMEERYETRHKALKEADTLLHSRIDDLKELIETYEESQKDTVTNALLGARAHKFLIWSGGIIGTLMITSAFGAWMWVIAMKGVSHG